MMMMMNYYDDYDESVGGYEKEGKGDGDDEL